MQAVLVQRFLLTLVSSGNIAADLHRVCQEHRGLLLNHHHIILDTHVACVLEIHVVLLSFAHAGRHLVEHLQRSRYFLCRHLCQQLVRLDEHLVAREDSRVLVPFDMHCLAAATHGRFVHHVVVKQREVMEHLQRQCRRYHVIHHVADYGQGIARMGTGDVYRLCDIVCRGRLPFQGFYRLVNINHFCLYSVSRLSLRSVFCQRSGLQ